ncbi:BREX-1 system adenine-specific DNA-methyltransferase PglX [Limosilactobacillus vaginalis]|uniref:BREX-1 system adenine-specific DNA-methyltransferase PglX n=1 Tax=Limosilactobacillus vaginalis TaxID=1633 RepID=UPI002359A18E|nr:BREX-1 system adenine-specific DNA-methyltransferase PglX [Limosilactobacillus vaginalis]WCT59795.1 BREX-1 system adenine-specific DNA-methyltransferase PglX [Limosilactobacillus vaginalis]
MDKTKIKNFAVNARKELIDSVRQRLANFGIDKTGIADELPISTAAVKYYTNEHFPLKGKAIGWRKQIVSRLNQDTNQEWDKKLNQFIDEVAYTWFNRIIAIRFMEVNDYLPSRTRVLSSEEGRIEPDMITHALEIEDDLGGYSDKERTQITDALMSHNPTQLDKVFGMLFIKQTDELSNLLPGLFEKTSNYMKLLFVPNYSNGVIKKLVDEIPEEDFDVSKSGQVSIIGWLYQYYISELHDQVVNITGKKAVKKADIPAATQLFTTDWVVKYMVDNSLGKYYLERHPQSSIKDDLKYLLPAKMELVQNGKQLIEYKFLDNAMGSGHVLIYAFDVFMKMYQEEGYSSREAVLLILENNLYGFEIDKRAYQLAYFAVMMKARQYDRRIFKRDIHLNLYLFKDLVLPSAFYDRLPQQIADELKETMADFSNATEYGSIMQINSHHDWDKLMATVNSIEPVEDLDIDGINRAKDNALQALNLMKLLTSKYEVVVTNPPYLNKFDKTLKKYLNNHYHDYSKDLFTVFVYHNQELLSNNGYAGFMTPFVWMFIKTYEPLRRIIINHVKIDSLIQMEYSAYEEATVPIDSFVLKKTHEDTIGTYIRLSNFKGGMDVQRDKVIKAIDNPNSDYLYHTDQDNFNKIPGSPIAYWAPQALINDFEKGKPLGQLVDAKVGLQTGNNKRFLRYWYEVDFNNIFFDAHNTAEAKQSGKKWFPYNKGGSYRKWYGNYDYVVNWQNDGYEIKHFTDSRGKVRSRPQNTDYYFKKAVTWSDVTSGDISARYRQTGSIHDVTGMSAFRKSTDLKSVMGLLNSKVGNYIFKILNPTIHAQIGNFLNIPFLNPESGRISHLVNENIDIEKKDWNNQETSWNFDKNQLVEQSGTLQLSYEHLVNDLNTQRSKVQSNETELNRVFIDLYGLSNELDANIEETKISMENPQNTDHCELTVKRLLSYFIGCVFGRYSLDKTGLAYAGGKWNESVYTSFKPNQDNLILLTDRDYFGDDRDIINRLREFLRITFDPSSLKDNLHFIAKTLDPKKSERGESDEQIIRNYFINDFYKDHDRTYHKRPIYWQFNSGRNDGFKALMYLHRYNKDELAMARNHLHDLQAAYSNTIKFNDEQETKSSTAREKNQYRKDTVKLNKKITEVIKYDEALQHQALAQVSIDLDDGVVVNHAKVQGNEELFSKL